MGKTSSAVKNKWIASHYTQIKIAVVSELAESFKALCRAKNVSMTGELSGFMAERCKKAASNKRPKKDLLSTRGGRRTLTNELSLRLEDVRNAETDYLSNIPDNLQGSVRYEAAERCVSYLNDAIDALSCAFD